MKLTNVIATGALLVAIAFAPVITKAQDAEVKHDKKNINKEEDKKAADLAKRNEAEKNGNAKQAVKDEKKVQKDNKKIDKDRKDIKKEEGKK
jgi:hypothetical protein